ncbi:MAG: pseudouridine synthase [Pseudomonadota bacterium]
MTSRKTKPRGRIADRTLSIEQRKVDRELNAAPERLQKVLATAGLGSRRGLEKRIERGDIRVNGQTSNLGDQVQAGDRVALDGHQWLVSAEQVLHQTLVYHKPEGEVTTRSDPEGRRTVFDRLPSVQGGRWIAIGRLDLNTAGLLLLTTDGELANQMMHPSGGVDREYLCRIRGQINDEQIQRLLAGIELEDGPAKFSDLIIGEQTAGHTWYTVTLLEGRNREVRRLWDAVGAQVARLKRVRFGPVFLPAGVRTGRYQRLSNRDHRVLREDTGLPPYPVQLTLYDARKGRSAKQRTTRPSKRRPTSSRRRRSR